MQSHSLKLGSEYKAIELLRTNRVKEECNIPVPPGYRVEGCAKTISLIGCQIVVNADVTNEILGHELRHCFDGNWHSDDGL